MGYLRETTDPQSGPIRAAGGQALADQLMDEPKALDLVQRAEALRSRSLLLISGAMDGVAPTAEHHEPLVKALRAAGAQHVRGMVIEGGDHAFSAQRVALASALVQWLMADCGR